MERFVFLVLTVFIVCDKTVGQNVYNFTCDLSPDQHDKILQEAVNQLQNGDLSTKSLG